MQRPGSWTPVGVLTPTDGSHLGGARIHCMPSTEPLDGTSPASRPTADSVRGPGIRGVLLGWVMVRLGLVSTKGGVDGPTRTVHQMNTQRRDSWMARACPVPCQTRKAKLKSVTQCQ